MNKLTSTATKKYPNRWTKGVSGNPAGRPKRPITVKQLAQTNVEDCILRLVEIVRNPNCDCKAHVFALAVLMGIVGNQNLMRRFLKKTKQQVWEYLFLPPAPRTNLNPNEISPQLAKILAARQSVNQWLIDKRARAQARLERKRAS